MKRKRCLKLVRAHATRFMPPEKRNEAYLSIREFRIMPDSCTTYQELWDRIMAICDGDSRGVGVKRR